MWRELRPTDRALYASHFGLAARVVAKRGAKSSNATSSTTEPGKERSPAGGRGGGTWVRLAHLGTPDPPVERGLHTQEGKRHPKKAFARTLSVARKPAARGPTTHGAQLPALFSADAHFATASSGLEQAGGVAPTARSRTTGSYERRSKVQSFV